MNDRENVKRQCDSNIVNEELFCLVKNAAGTKLRKRKAEAGDQVLATYCNVAVQKVAHAVGYNGLDIPDTNPAEPLMANDMLTYMRLHKEWIECTPGVAQAKAISGCMVVAAHGQKAHGHVAVVYPDGGLVYSGRWQIECPIVANVGKNNEIFGANFAFDTHEIPPEYFYLNL